jgi:hypothetical protein
MQDAGQPFLFFLPETVYVGLAGGGQGEIYFTFVTVGRGFEDIGYFKEMGNDLGHGLGGDLFHLGQFGRHQAVVLVEETQSGTLCQGEHFVVVGLFAEDFYQALNDGPEVTGDLDVFLRGVGQGVWVGGR